MNIMKLVIFVGTRPEIIRLSATINLARKYFDVTLVHTGQNYDYNLNDVFFNDLNIKEPEHYLNCSKDNVGRAVGDIIAKSYELLNDIKPDALLILGDTNSCLCAYSAKRLKIPIFHLEAGNRSFDPNVPEEINRKIIDHISDINMCYVEQSRDNLLKENVKPQYTFVVGSPMPEIFSNIKDKIKNSSVLAKYNLETGNYFVWSTHREDNVDNEINFNQIVNSINMLSQKYKKKIIFGVHPRTNKMLQKLNIKFDCGDNVILTEPFGIIDYYCLLQNSLCVISDSGTISEEANIMGFKAVLLRVSTEHPETIDAGSIVLGNIKWNNLQESLSLVLDSSNIHNKIVNYYDINFSEKVCKIIIGYYEIVNKFLWMKSQT
jgi:UDP-N-acetylglucosamine 2-epimerase (non-hydrolysing)